MPPAFLMGFPMPTAMTTLGRLGKDHMFLWAWGINGCFSVIGAALVPIIATSFGLPAVVLVGAIAYLVALPAFFSVLMPLAAEAASGCVKRRALLLGALLMPTAAHARTTKQKQAAKKPAAVPKPPPPPPSRPAAAEGGQDPAGRLQRLGLSLSRPRSPTPTSRSSTRATASGAATPRCSGDVCWEDTTYSDRRSLLYLPAGYNPQLPVADRALPARPGRHARARRDRAPGDPAADRRVGAERRAGGAAARRRCRRIRAPAISGSPVISPPTSTKRPSG